MNINIYISLKSTSSIPLNFKINTWILKVYFKYNSEFKKKYINLKMYFLCTSEFEHKIFKFRKATSSILFSLKINTSIYKIYFKYTFEFEYKDINLESLHILLSLKTNTSILNIKFSKSEVFVYDNFFFSLLYAFQKQEVKFSRSRLEVTSYLE